MVESITVVGLTVALFGFEIQSRLARRLDRPSDGLEPHLLKWLPAIVLAGFLLVVE